MTYKNAVKVFSGRVLLIGLFAASAVVVIGEVQAPTVPVAPNWCNRPVREQFAKLEKVPSADAWFEVYRVTPGVFAIYEPRQAEEAISYLIVGEKRAAMFDTGLGIGDIKRVVESLTSLPVTVMNSHTHNDHVGGNWQFSDIYGMDTNFTRTNAKGSSVDAQSELAPGSVCGALPDGFDAKAYSTRPFHVSKWIHDGERVDLGGRVLEVISTSGHTPDAISLLDRKNGLLFTGDTYYPGTIWLYRQETDMDAYVRSVGRMAALAPNLHLLLPAHNVPTADPAELPKLVTAAQEVMAGGVKSTAAGEGKIEYKVHEFSFLMAAKAGTATDGAKGVQVGGADVVTLVRKPTAKGGKPEFLSVTLLPGRGMNVFQMTADLPGKGSVNLLKSPSIGEAARVLNGTGEDAFGNLNHSFGAAFLIPFSSRISGTVSADAKTITTSWRGHTITLPNDFMGKYAVHGLINELKAQDLRTTDTADGQTVTGVIHAGDFGGHWLSKTDLHFTIALTGGAVEVTVEAKNVGTEIEPMAVGWHPYLAIPSGDRAQARIHIPAATVARLAGTDGQMTGDLDPVTGTARDFNASEGRVLDESLNNNFSHLTRKNGVVNAWLADPKWDYGIRVAGLSPQINTIHVYSPKNNTFAAIEEQFNFQDPFGVEWKGMDTGMVPLTPGESVTWKVRLELFRPSEGAAAGN